MTSEHIHVALFITVIIQCSHSLFFTESSHDQTCNILSCSSSAFLALPPGYLTGSVQHTPVVIRLHRCIGFIICFHEFIHLAIDEFDLFLHGGLVVHVLVFSLNSELHTVRIPIHKWGYQPIVLAMCSCNLCVPYQSLQRVRVKYLVILNDNLVFIFGMLNVYLSDRSAPVAQLTGSIGRASLSSVLMPSAHFFGALLTPPVIPGADYTLFADVIISHLLVSGISYHDISPLSCWNSRVQLQSCWRIAHSFDALVFRYLLISPFIVLS